MQLEIKSCSKIIKDLKEEFPNFTDFELYTLAIQIQRNLILENGLNVSRNDKHPASLEAIAIALGYTK
jgi:hypothetical protein